jgi:hypothetical protein
VIKEIGGRREREREKRGEEHLLTPSCAQNPKITHLLLQTTTPTTTLNYSRKT